MGLSSGHAGWGKTGTDKEDFWGEGFRKQKGGCGLKKGPARTVLKAKRDTGQRKKGTNGKGGEGREGTF